MVINNFVRLNVRKRAKYLCEYCHSPERSNATPFTIDHIITQSLGGSDEIHNLALACHRCNQRRYNFRTGIDPETQAEVPLFNPRNQNWSEHFISRLFHSHSARLRLNSEAYRKTRLKPTVNYECSPF